MFFVMLGVPKLIEGTWRDFARFALGERAPVKKPNEGPGVSLGPSGVTG